MGTPVPAWALGRRPWSDRVLVVTLGAWLDRLEKGPTPLRYPRVVSEPLRPTGGGQWRLGGFEENRPNPTDCLTTDQDSTAAGKATDQPLQISTSGTWTERHPTNGWTESIETAGPHPTSPTALGEEPVRWRAAPHDTAVTWFSPTTLYLSLVPGEGGRC